MASNLNTQFNNLFYPNYDKINKFSYYLIWGLAYFSMTSCLIRNDYNVIFSFLMLFIFSNFTNENKKYYSKVLIHILLGLILADLFWFIFIIPNKNYKKSINVSFIESLNTMNTICFYLGIFEILIKICILGLVLYDFRNFYPSQLSFLMNFDYKIPEVIHEDGFIKSPQNKSVEPIRNTTANISNNHNRENFQINNNNNFTNNNNLRNF